MYPLRRKQPRPDLAVTTHFGRSDFRPSSLPVSESVSAFVICVNIVLGLSLLYTKLTFRVVQGWCPHSINSNAVINSSPLHIDMLRTFLLPLFISSQHGVWWNKSLALRVRIHPTRTPFSQPSPNTSSTLRSLNTHSTERSLRFMYTHML